MPTTTNYGWTTPADTDLVKDGAAAIRTLGSSIDSTLKTQIDAQIPDSLLTTKGDLIAATGASTPARLGVGTNGQALIADSTTATGLKWDTPAAGGMTLISTTTLSGASTTLSSIPQTYNSLFLIISGITTNIDSQLRLLPNNSSTLCNGTGVYDNSGEAPSINGEANSTMSLTNGVEILKTNANNVFAVRINNYTSTTSFKPYMFNGLWGDSSSRNWVNNFSGTFRSNSAISSIVLDAAGTNTFSTGTVLLYGVK